MPLSGPRAGIFFVVEGIEGSGKSTLVEGIAGRLRDEGHEVVTTREPGGTPLGNAVRKILLDRSSRLSALTESLLVNAARAQHVSDVIRPSLDAGSIVLCDRFTDSTLAYQGWGRGLDLQLLRGLCAVATGGLESQITLLLDVPVNVARERMHERLVGDRIEDEADAFHERVRQGFLALAQDSPRHQVLDGTLAPEILVERSLAIVGGLFGARVT